MSLGFHFRHSTSIQPALHKPSIWTPPLPKNTNLLKYFSLITKDIDSSHFFALPFESPNLTEVQISDLRKLKNNPYLIFKPADKGGGIVIMNKHDYILKAKEQINNTKYYKKLDSNPTLQIARDVSDFINYLEIKNIITNKIADFLQPTFPPRTPVFYGLPKIHKKECPLRPIVSANESPTENLSAFIDYICQPIMKNLNSYIKDTKDFLKLILTFPPLPPGAILVTADVVSLYTNIPQDEGIDILIETIREHSNILPPETPPPPTIKIMMEFILKQNCFEFIDEFYQQVHGTAMGSKCAPPYACIYMGKFEQMKILPLSQAIILWKRFIDDIFFIYTGSEEELQILFDKINNLHPTLKFTFQYSTNKINFLDTTIHIDKNNNKMFSSLYTKPTDTSSLLHYNSFHPENTKTSIIYSQALRYRLIISKDDMLIEALNKLKSVLTNRGYPKQIIKNQIKKISKLTQLQVLFQEKNPTTPQKNKNLVFSTPHSIHNPGLKDILHKHWHLISDDPELRQIWTTKPLLATMRHNNIKDSLVRTRTSPTSK